MKNQILPRRNILKAALAAGCSLWMPITLAAEETRKGTSTANTAANTAAPAKVTQESVKYQAKPSNAQKCADCLHFIKESNTCKLVDGKISPEGWCILWVKKA